MRVGIIGAGATGLTAGYELCKKGHLVTLFEEEKEVGGLVSSFLVGEQYLEKFYHHIFTNDTVIIDLIEEIGLSDSLKWISPKSGLYINRKLYPFSTPIDLIRFREIPLIERVLLGLLVIRSKSINNWKALDQYTAKEWVIKYAGKNAYEKFWAPLLNSKFDIDADKISAVWLWNKFKLRGSTRKSNVSKEMFGYLEGSFGRIYKKLEQEITKMGGEIFYGCPAKSIKENNDGTLTINTLSEQSYNFDKVIFTTAPVNLKRMGLSLPTEYEKNLDRIKYKSNICAVIESKSQVSPYYWVTVAQKDSPFVLMVEHTNIMPVDEYGSNVVYLSRYLDQNNPMFSMPDKEIMDIFLDYLNGMFPSFKKDDVKSYKISRAQYTQPVVYKNYYDTILGFESPVANLYLANMTQIYPEDRGQNYSIKLGKEVAELICERG